MQIEGSLRQMNLIILYASILIQGQTMNLEFKNALFKTQKECKYYLQGTKTLLWIH